MAEMGVHPHVHCASACGIPASKPLSVLDRDSLLASFSERQISKRTGVHRDMIRLIRHGKGVKRSTYAKVVNFLKENSGRVHGTRGAHI